MNTAQKMRLLSKQDTGQHNFNLVDFFIKWQGSGLSLYALSDFKKLVVKATSDDKSVEIDEAVIQFENTEIVTDTEAMDNLSESVLDLNTPEGRLAFRKRLGVLAFFLKQQAECQPGDLSLEESTVVCWVKNQKYQVFCVSVVCDTEEKIWIINALSPSNSSPATRFLSEV